MNQEFDSLKLSDLQNELESSRESLHSLELTHQAVKQQLEYHKVSLEVWIKL